MLSQITCRPAANQGYDDFNECRNFICECDKKMVDTLVVHLLARGNCPPNPQCTDTGPPTSPTCTATATTGTEGITGPGAGGGTGPGTGGGTGPGTVTGTGSSTCKPRWNRICRSFARTGGCRNARRRQWMRKNCCTWPCGGGGFLGLGGILA